MFQFTVKATGDASVEGHPVGGAVVASTLAENIKSVLGIGHGANIPWEQLIDTRFEIGQ